MSLNQHHSYLFKLHYTPSSTTTTTFTSKQIIKRFGFSGTLRDKKVYTGIHDRAAQVFKLKKSHFCLTTTSAQDAVPLLSYAAYLDQVTAMTSPLDHKSRIIVNFYVVEKKLSPSHSPHSSHHHHHHSHAHKSSTKPELNLQDDEEAYRSDRSLRKQVGRNKSSHLPPLASVPVVFNKDTIKTSPFGEDIDMEGIGKFRCLRCFKLFSSMEFVEKHIDAKHETEVVAPAHGVPTSIETVEEEINETTAPASKEDIVASVKSYLTDFLVGFNSHLELQLGNLASELQLDFGVAPSSATAAVVVGEESKEDELVKNVVKEKVVAKVEPVEAVPVVIAPVAHPASCDHCDQVIKGIRYKCETCPDFDTCSVCYAAVAETHPTHNFYAITDPTALNHFVPLPSSLPHHTNTFCDECQSPIRGIRYKCMTCDDFDLCEACVRDPLKQHDEHHHLLMIRRPVSFMRRKDLEAIKVDYDAMTVKEVVVKAPIFVESQVEKIEVQPVEPEEENEVVLVKEEVADEKKVETVVAVAGEEEIRLVTSPRPSLLVRDLVDHFDAIGAASTTILSATSAPAVAAVTSEIIPYSATFVSDITLPDGSIVPAGGEFRKIWQVKNTGSMIWTVVRLILIEGTSVIQESREIIVDDVQPGETIEIGCELKAPETEGRVKSFWRLHVGEERIAFGDRLWIDINVESADNLASSHSHSLSSSFVTPTSFHSNHSSRHSHASSSAPPSIIESIPDLVELERSQLEDISSRDEGSQVGSDHSSLNEWSAEEELYDEHEDEFDMVGEDFDHID